MKLKSLIIVLFLTLKSMIVTGQEVFSIENDTLLSLDYITLIEKVNESNSIEIGSLYAKIFLKKAKFNKDDDYIIGGYEILGSIYEKEKALPYLDSIIAITEKIPDNFNPSNAYLNKARKLYSMRKFKSSFDNYLKASEFAKLKPNKQLLFESRYGIGLLKARVGGYEESIQFQKENLTFFENNPSEINKDHRLNVLFCLATAYAKIGIVDSARYYNKNGIRNAKLLKNEDLSSLFGLNEAIVKFKSGNNQEALDGLEKAQIDLKKLEDLPNLIFVYFYLGNLSISDKKEDLGIEYLKKVDSLFTLTGDIHPEVRDSYNTLTTFYKNQNDKPNQLKYLERLIKVDSVLNDYKIYLVDKINTEYDTPELISQKEALIEDLNKDKSRLFRISLVLICLSVMLVFRHIKNQVTYKRRFEELMNEQNQKISNSKTNVSIESDIPKEILIRVIEGLKRFEIEKGYLASNLNLSSLAKQLGTNSTYLSKIVNNERSKNFTSYLNDLRIEYALIELKNNSQFRKFTIKAIAIESGFKSAETFSKIFKSKTGIYPSFFIKQLEKVVK